MDAKRNNKKIFNDSHFQIRYQNNPYLSNSGLLNQNNKIESLKNISITPRNSETPMAINFLKLD